MEQPTTRKPATTIRALSKAKHNEETCPTCQAQKKEQDVTTIPRRTRRKKVKARRPRVEKEKEVVAGEPQSDGPSAPRHVPVRKPIHASILWFRNGTPILSDTRSSQPSRWDINMDAFAWFRDNRADYVPSTYHRFLSYKRGLEEQNLPWNGFTHNKFLCYFIYFGTDPSDQISMVDPRTKRSITLPRASRVLFSAPVITPTTTQEENGVLSATGNVDCWLCYWERINDGPVPGSALSEQLIVEWLERTPNATIKDCISQFAEHLRDGEKNERDRFTQIVRKVAAVQEQRLVLRPQWRGPAPPVNSTAS